MPRGYATGEDIEKNSEASKSQSGDLVSISCIYAEYTEIMHINDRLILHYIYA